MRLFFGAAVTGIALLVVPTALADGGVNGSFETGTLAGWNASGNASVVAGGVDGKYMGQVTAGDEDVWQSLEQSFQVEVGDKISASSNFVNEEDDFACFYADEAQVLVFLNGTLVATFMQETSCGVPSGETGWVKSYYEAAAGGTLKIVIRVRNIGDSSVDSYVWIDGVSQSFNTQGWCSVAGNTHPFTGQPIAPGTFLQLRVNQALTSPSYKGATPAIFVAGKGLTCDPPPAGYKLDGLATDADHVGAGFYPKYVPAS